MLLLLLAAAAGGCRHQVSGGPAAGVDMSRYRSFYVVTDKKDNPVAVALEKDLTARSLKPTTGLDWAMPSDAQVKVVFKAKWGRDVTRYLQEVTIDMVDAHNGARLAGGRCSRSSMARKPVEEMVKEVNDRIFRSPPQSSLQPSLASPQSRPSPPP